MENNFLNGENSENLNQENSSFFDEKVSSSNSNEGCKPTLRFDEFCSTWQKMKLGDFCHIVMGQSPDSNSYNDFQQGLPLVQGNADIKDRITVPQRYTTLPTKVCEANSIIMSVRAPVGTIALSNQKICLGRGVCAINTTNNSFLYQYLLKSENSWKNIEQGGTFTAINSNDIKNFQLYITTIKEQQKIADFLSLVDKRIEKQRQLVENLKKYKRGLLSAIFERKIRFKDDNGNDYPEWKKTHLGSIFNERTARADGNEELLAVTINEGIKKRNEIDLKDNSSDDKSNYKKVYIGDIAYNTMRMWQGASGVSKYNGIVSPAYTVIFPSSEIDIEFFGYYFKYIKVIQIFQKFSQGLTSDTWNLKFPQFAEINLYLPSINEQKIIAAFLKSFDNKILHEEAFLNNLTKKKRGLLQQMFI